MEIEFKKIKADNYYISDYEKKWCRPCSKIIFNHTIVIDIERIKRSCRKFKLDFDLMLSTCISHEWIHYILERDISENVSCQFDNLYQKLKKTKSKFHQLGIGL